WEAFEGGDREIRYHNLESGRTAILGPDPAVDLFPDTYGPFSVWQSDRDGNGQYELYFFNTQLLPPQQVQLDAGASVTTGLCPGENATLVLETAGPGLEAVWFDDDMMSNELYADAANLFEPVVSGPTTFYGAWRDPITGCIAPLAAAAVVAEPTDILGCNDMFSINLSDFCQATLDASILEGVFGCLQADDFVIDVQDINPGNGPVVDEAGSYVYTVDLAPGVTANFTGCFGMVEAQDGLPPILTCPDDLTVQAPPGAMEASVNAPIPTWDDNCAVDASTLMVTTPFNPSDPFPIGQTTMGFSIMDISGNLGECSYIVEVLPASADVILEVGSNVTTVGNQVCVDVTVQNFADVAAMQFTLEYDPALLGNPSVTDIGLPGFNNSNYAFPAPGFITFSWFTSPAVTLPDGSVIFQLCFDALMEGLSPLNITGSPTPLEISDGNSNALPVTANPGSITINGALVLACPNDIVQPNNPGICEALINIPVPTMPGPGTLVNSYTGGDNASGLYPVGVTTVTYTFFGAGDTLMCSFTVEVQDIEPPIIICPASLQVDGEAAAGGATVNFPAPAVADNCPVAVLDCNHLSGELFPCGPTTVTCTATDTSGNQSECAFTVAVNCSPDTCCLDFNGVTIVDPLNLTGGLADTGFDFIDADNDGDQDIIAYNTVGVLAIIRNQPPYDPPNFELFNPIALFYNAISPSTLDYNQDGFEDFFALELGTNEVIYYENQGIIGTPAFNVIPTGLVLPPQATDIAVGDLGNDGIADLLVHLNVGGINAVYYEGGCQAPVIPCFTLVGNDYATPFIDLPLAPVTSTNKFELFDGDCDGDLDLFMADGDALSLNPVVWYFENYGGVTPSGSLPNVENVNYLTDPFGLTGWSSNSDAVLLRLADVDNDQQAEAFLDAGSMSYFDNFCLTADSCCVDSLAFADLVAQGFTVTLNDSCGVTVTAPQFNSCHWFTTPPDWGDGTGTFQVVVPANGTWMYTYAQGGTYDICVTVFEADSLGATPCWSAQMCTTVTVNCDCPDISLTPSPSVPDSSLVGCCWNLAYSNAGADTVYGIRLIPLDGVDLSVHNEEPDFMVTSTINGALIVPTGFGPMPPSAPTLADICLNHVLATPQYVAVQYMDGALMPFCFDTLVFNCPVEETCLYIVTDSLKCDTNGYKYVATVTNPSGADFPVKYVKLNVTSGPPGLSLLPQAGIELPDTLYQGDTTMVMWNFPTDEDWFGDTLCFILSAHDGPEERLCCAEIDTCLAFPACDPCKYKDVAVAVSTLPGTGGGGDCFGGNPLLEPWLQDLIAGCAGDPCGMLVYCCLYQGQPVVNVQDDDMA
ncbi:MAG: HYR domain-containing protein, partial [Phaeodactylibacter sp.]|nr:HYR domain-containing protein [Phaeodactylibacter sp.]